MSGRIVSDVASRVMEKLSADSNVLSNIWSGKKKIIDAIKEALPTIDNLAGKEPSGNLLHDLAKSTTQGQYNPSAMSLFMTSPGSHGNYRASYDNDTTSIPRTIAAGVAGNLAAMSVPLATYRGTGSFIAALASMLPSTLLGHRVGYDVRNALDSTLGPTSGGILGVPDTAYRYITDTPESKLEVAKAIVEGVAKTPIGAPKISVTTNTRPATSSELRERLGF